MTASASEYLPEFQYPPTLDGSIEVVATHEQIPVVARRTGEVEDGAEVYILDGSVPLRAFGAGRVVLHLDRLPAMSTLKFAIVDEEHPVTEKQTPLDRAYGRVAALLGALGETGDDTRTEVRSDTYSVRVVREWQVAGRYVAMFRNYPPDTLATFADAQLAARLREDLDAMDRGLVSSVMATIVDRGHRLHLSVGDLLGQVRL